jgi:hypothetical protein
MARKAHIFQGTGCSSKVNEYNYVLIAVHIHAQSLIIWHKLNNIARNHERSLTLVP